MYRRHQTVNSQFLSHVTPTPSSFLHHPPPLSPPAFFDRHRDLYPPPLHSPSHPAPPTSFHPPPPIIRVTLQRGQPIHTHTQRKSFEEEQEHTDTGQHTLNPDPTHIFLLLFCIHVFAFEGGGNRYILVLCIVHSFSSPLPLPLLPSQLHRREYPLLDRESTLSTTAQLFLFVSPHPTPPFFHDKTSLPGRFRFQFTLLFLSPPPSSSSSSSLPNALIYFFDMEKYVKQNIFYCSFFSC